MFLGGLDCTCSPDVPGSLWAAGPGVVLLILHSLGRFEGVVVVGVCVRSLPVAAV